MQALQTQRGFFQSYNACIFNIFHGLLKDRDNRDKVLQWLGAVAHLNSDRRKMRYNAAKTSGDSFMINVSTLALKLALPITRRPKFDSVDISYVFKRNPGPRVSYSIDTTRIHATPKEVQDHEKQLSGVADPSKGNEFGFSTECFFVAHEILHLGLISYIKKFTQDQQNLSRRQHELQRLDRSHPMQEQIYQMEKARLGRDLALMLGMKVFLEDPVLLADSLQVRFRRAIFASLSPLPLPPTSFTTGLVLGWSSLPGYSFYHHDCYFPLSVALLISFFQE